MRVSKEQVAQHRQALIEATGRLLREKGLEGAGVAEICHEAGLTHGAFYRHFASKEALMLEACGRAFDWTPLELLGKRARESGTTAMVANYLSVDHRDCSELGCPVAALAVDAARAGGEIAQAFAEEIEAYLSKFTQAVHVKDPTALDAEAQALHMLSTMVGGLIIARATAQARPQLSRKVLRTLTKRMAVPAAPTSRRAT
jgi:TetR/AcrR family transcriptional repressor of nem operon